LASHSHWYTIQDTIIIVSCI